ERPLLSWTTRPCYPAAIAFIAALGWAFAYVAGWVVDDCRAWAGNAPGPFQPGNLVAHLLFAFCLAFMFVAVACAVACAIIHGPTPRCIAFGPDVLYFDPPLFARQPPHGVTEVMRSELGAIRGQKRMGLPWVTIGRGAGRRAGTPRDRRDPAAAGNASAGEPHALHRRADPRPR